jgi:hypothetical protein
VTENIAALHDGLVAVEQMKIRAADGASGDLDDRVAGMLNFRIRYGIYPDVAFSVPA